MAEGEWRICISLQQLHYWAVLHKVIDIHTFISNMDLLRVRHNLATEQQPKASHKLIFLISGIHPVSPQTIREVYPKMDAVNF